MKPFLKCVRTLILAIFLIVSLFNVSNTLAAPKIGVTIQSVRRLDPNPTSAEVVNFLVTFSHSVIDVDLGDFGLTVTGDITDVHLSGISGSGKTRIVAVNTGSGNGTIRLDVIDNDTIESSGGAYFERAFFGGQAYTIEKLPAVSTISLPDTNPTLADSVDFVITFPEEVGSIDVSDFTPVITGKIRDVAISTVQGDGNTYIVTVSTGFGDGTISLSILENNNITDLNGNPLEKPLFSTESYTVQKPHPIVFQVTCLNANPTNAYSVDFSVVFSKPVIDLDKDDFKLATTGDIQGAAVTSLSGNEDEYVVSVNAGSGSGTIRLDVIDNDTIEDLDGNFFDDPYSSGEICTIHRETVETTINQGVNPAAAGTMVFEVVFSVPVIGFDESDIIISGISDTSTITVSGTGSAYTVEVVGITGDEIITADILPNSVQDDMGNFVQVSSRPEIIRDHVPQNEPTVIETPAEGSALWVILIMILVVIVVVFIVIRLKKES